MYHSAPYLPPFSSPKNPELWRSCRCICRQSKFAPLLSPSLPSIRLCHCHLAPAVSTISSLPIPPSQFCATTLLLLTSCRFCHCHPDVAIAAASFLPPPPGQVRDFVAVSAILPTPSLPSHRYCQAKSVPPPSIPISYHCHLANALPSPQSQVCAPAIAVDVAVIVSVAVAAVLPFLSMPSCCCLAAILLPPQDPSFCHCIYFT